MTKRLTTNMGQELRHLGNVEVSVNTYSDVLQHHGILGMKWGIRRYQNADGTLTEAGKRRYERLNKKLINNIVSDDLSPNSIKRGAQIASKADELMSKLSKEDQKLFNEQFQRDLSERLAKKEKNKAVKISMDTETWKKQAAVELEKTSRHWRINTTDTGDANVVTNVSGTPFYVSFYRFGKTAPKKLRAKDIEELADLATNLSSSESTIRNKALKLISDYTENRSIDSSKFSLYEMHGRTDSKSGEKQIDFAYDDGGSIFGEEFSTPFSVTVNANGEIENFWWI